MSPSEELIEAIAEGCLFILKKLKKEKIFSFFKQYFI